MTSFPDSLKISCLLLLVGLMFLLFFGLDELEKVNSGLRQDIVKLRGTVKSLDIEKDNLQQQVDEKTERVMALDARRLKQVKHGRNYRHCS